MKILGSCLLVACLFLTGFKEEERSQTFQEYIPATDESVDRGVADQSANSLVFLRTTAFENTPDDAAVIDGLARRFHVPVDLVREYRQDYIGRASAEDIIESTRDIQNFLEYLKQQNAASLMQDDLLALTDVEGEARPFYLGDGGRGGAIMRPDPVPQTWGNIVTGLLSTLGHGREIFVQGIRQQLGTAFGFEEVTKDALRRVVWSRAAQANQVEIPPILVLSIVFLFLFGAAIAHAFSLESHVGWRRLTVVVSAAFSIVLPIIIDQTSYNASVEFLLLVAFASLLGTAASLLYGRKIFYWVYSGFSSEAQSSDDLGSQSQPIRATSATAQVCSTPLMPSSGNFESQESIAAPMAINVSTCSRSYCPTCQAETEYDGAHCSLCSLIEGQKEITKIWRWCLWGLLGWVIVAMLSSLAVPEYLLSDMSARMGFSQLTRSGFFFVLIFLGVSTWAIGLAPPLVTRYGILRRSMSRWAALSFAGIQYFLNVVFFALLGSSNKTHTVLFLVGMASYGILTHSSGEEAEELNE